MQQASFAAALLYLTAAVPGWCQAAGPDAPPAAAVKCELPSELITPEADLPRVTAAMSKRGEVAILAIGSGSTVGEATGTGGAVVARPAPRSSFPYRAVEALQASKPSAKFNLTVKGGRNMTAEEMVPLLRQALAAHQYDLLLWQTGTVEAVRGLRPEAMGNAVRDGIDAAMTSGADVVVIDPQYSRFLRANTDIGPYENTLRQITTVAGVPLFRRFDLTHIWVSDGDIDLERVNRDARDQTITRLNMCLGRALAAFVLAGAGER